MLPHAQLRSTHFILGHYFDYVADFSSHESAYMPCVELMGKLRFLTLSLRSPQRNTDTAPSKNTPKCDKKQPQGRIVDLLKKRAQQPPLDTRPGLRPLDTSRSSGANKLGENSNKPDSHRFGAAITTNGRSSAYAGKAVKGTRQLRGATRDKHHLSAVGRISPTKAVTSSLLSDTSADRGRERVIQSSATTRSNLLSQPAHAQTSSTQASVDPSIGLIPDVVDSGILGHSVNPQSSQAIPAKSPITCASPRDPSSPKGLSVEAPHTHRLSVKWSAFPNEIAPSLHTHSNFIFGTRLILHLQLQYRIWNPQLSRPQLSRLLVLSLTYHRRHINVYSFSSALTCIIITTLARHNTLASQFIPVVSPSQCEHDKPSETVSVHSPIVHPNLPTPELIDAFSPAPPHKWESAYNHPALQLPADDDSEWSTLPQRKPRPRQRSKDLIKNSAKFYLPIGSRVRSSTKEPHEERTEKRPRITLYHPPPRTVNVDLTGIESRYACVRGAIRKVRIPR